MRASLDCHNGGKNIYLTLQSRGSEPFVFYDAQQADEDLRIQPHIRETSADESQQPPNPLVLVHLKPLSLLNSPRSKTDPDGKTLLEPGQLRTEIQPDALRLFAHGTLECLVRISFWRATPEGEDLLERGWAMPAPSKVGFAMEAKKTTA